MKRFDIVNKKGTENNHNHCSDLHSDIMIISRTCIRFPSDRMEGFSIIQGTFLFTL